MNCGWEEGTRRKAANKSSSSKTISGLSVFEFAHFAAMWAHMLAGNSKEGLAMLSHILVLSFVELAFALSQHLSFLICCPLHVSHACGCRSHNSHRLSVIPCNTANRGMMRHVSFPSTSYFRRSSVSESGGPINFFLTSTLVARQIFLRCRVFWHRRHVDPMLPPRLRALVFECILQTILREFVSIARSVC